MAGRRAHGSRTSFSGAVVVVIVLPYPEFNNRALMLRSRWARILSPVVASFDTHPAATTLLDQVYRAPIQLKTGPLVRLRG
jgi:hypothetical protein